MAVETAFSSIKRMYGEYASSINIPKHGKRDILKYLCITCLGW